MSTSAMSWSPDGDLAVAAAARLRVVEPPSKPAGPRRAEVRRNARARVGVTNTALRHGLTHRLVGALDAGPGRDQVLPSERPPQFKPVQTIGVAHTGLFDRDVFVTLAQQYRLTGPNRATLCWHNADVRAARHLCADGSFGRRRSAVVLTSRAERVDVACTPARSSRAHKAHQTWRTRGASWPPCWRPNC